MLRSKDFDFMDKFPRRTMVGRIYRIDTVGEGRRGCTSYEFDALDEARLESGDLRGLYMSDDVAPFGLIRVLTIPARFAKVFGVEPREGTWYQIELTPREIAAGVTDKLTAWHAQLTEGGYTKQSRGYITGAQFLSGDDEPPLKSLSSALSPAVANRQAAIAAAQFPSFNPLGKPEIQTLLEKFARVQNIKVHDVGQASFVTLFDITHRPIVHFDAGWPVSFNGKTIPAQPPVFQTAPVILSHWDWDHLSGYYRFPQLRNVLWVTPVQVLGFGAGRVATRLDATRRLAAFDGTPLSVNDLILGVCQGPRGNKNQTGLALRVALPPKTIMGQIGAPRAALITGDADYDHVPAALTAQPLHALVVTHHGANFEGTVPLGPIPRGPAIVSVGKGNTYKHPKVPALKRHKRRNWTIQMTAACEFGGSRHFHLNLR